MSEHWLPCGADGRAGGVRSRDSQIFWMGRFTYPWCSAGALRAPELRYKLRKIVNDLRLIRLETNLAYYTENFVFSPLYKDRTDN